MQRRPVHGVRLFPVGDLPAAFEHVTEVKWTDKTAIVILCSLMIIIGVYPAIIAPLFETGVVPIMKLLGGG